MVGRPWILPLPGWPTAFWYQPESMLMLPVGGPRPEVPQPYRAESDSVWITGEVKESWGWEPECSGKCWWEVEEKAQEKAIY